MEKVVAKTSMGFIASADKMLQPGKKNKQIGPNYRDQITVIATGELFKLFSHFLE